MTCDYEIRLLLEVALFVLAPPHDFHEAHLAIAALSVLCACRMIGSGSVSMVDRVYYVKRKIQPKLKSRINLKKTKS